MSNPTAALAFANSAQLHETGSTTSVSGSTDEEENQRPSNNIRVLIEAGNSSASLQELLRPGVQTRYAQLELMELAKSIVGHRQGPCYVTLKDVAIEGKAKVMLIEFQTVATAALSMVTSMFRKSERFCSKHILNHVTTAFAPAKICLLIGPPQSGKTTLLKYIAERLDSGLSSSGDLSFNGVHPHPSIMPRIVAYTPQLDDHTPALTVQQTLNFAFDCTASRHVHGMAKQNGLATKSTKEEGGDPRNKVNIIMDYCGLENCKNTVAGSDTLRGLSGGEKRRLTIAEQLVGTSLVNCMDEITTGLDSAAAHDIVESLANACHVFDKTTIISLLQPPPEVVNLFDEILLLGPSGLLLYHGPVSKAESYFQEEFGFKKPEALPLADYLVTLCTEEVSQYWSASNEGAPPTALEMAERWKRCGLFSEYIRPRFHEAVNHGRSKDSNAVNQRPWTTPFGATYMTLLKACFHRSFSILLGDRVLVRGIVIQRMIQGVIIGTIFWQTTKDGMKVPMLFLLASMLSMSNVYMVNLSIVKRPIFYKLRDSGFYPTWIYALSEFISELPLQVLEVCIIGFIAFFCVGFQQSTFPTFLLALLLICLAFVSIYKAIAANSRSASGAQGLAIGFIAFSMCFSGYMVTKGSIPDYFVWIYWILPFPWVLRILAINEFMSSGRNGIYDTLVAPTNKRLGDMYLETFSIPVDRIWIPLGFIYLLCIVVLFQALYALGLHFRRLECELPIIVKDKEKEKAERPGSATLNPIFEKDAMFEDAEENGKKAFAALRSISVVPPAVSLSLKNLCYTVTVPAPKDAGVKKMEKVLVNNIYAHFEPGTITALMGSSGAGKTTLMDVIAGRKTSGKIEGEILVNGHKQDLSTFARISGYVEQTDLHIGSLTVLEALRFSALHRLPPELSSEEKETVVQAVADLVELRPFLHKTIGGKGVGLSLEQRKRVTIGVEMAANPSILFLDEPTSGLDSRAAKMVMNVLRRITATGRTVICTVHQPSKEIFSMFDHLLLLKRGGWMVYNGDLGPTTQGGDGSVYTARNMIDYFESCSPLAPKLKPEMNPAEYMLDIVGAGLGTHAGRDKSVDFVRLYEESQMAKEMKRKVEGLTEGEKLHFSSRYATSLPTQLYYSTRRWASCHWRNVGYNLHRMIVVGIIALLFSLNLANLTLSEVTDQSTLQSFNGILFAGVFFTAAVQTNMAVQVLGDVKVVYYKELAAGMYTPFAYIFGLTMVELPWLVAVVGLHMIIFYPLVGLWTDPTYIAMYAITVFLLSTVFCFWGQLLAALTPSSQAAALIAGPTVGIMVLFSGFFVPGSLIPYPWKIFYFIFPAKYGIKAALPKQFYCSMSCLADSQDPSRRFDCKQLNVSSLAQAPFNADGPGCSLLFDLTGQVQQMKGAEWTQRNFGAAGVHRMTVWDYWSITTDSHIDEVPLYMGVLVIFVVVFRFLTYLALKYLKHINR